MSNLRSVVSIFSGAGGFDWGFHKAGFQTILACEKLVYPASTLAKNLNLTATDDENKFGCHQTPSVLVKDIKLVDFSRFHVSPDVLIGGPPCQDFSMAQGNERQGLNGGRGKLYVEFVRALMFFQPKFFVFENVPGLKSANDGVAYSTILSDLENLEQKRLEIIAQNAPIKIPPMPVHGYEILYSEVVHASKLGVPQTRKRLIILGIRKDLISNTSLEIINTLKKELANKLNGTDSLFMKYPLTCIEIFEGNTISNLDARYKEIIRAYGSLLQNSSIPAANSWKARIWDNLSFDIVKDYFWSNGLDYSNDYSVTEFREAMKQHESILADLGFLNKPIQTQVFPDKSNLLPDQSESVIKRLFNIPPDENYAFVDGTEWEVEGKNISFIYRRSAPLKPAWTVLAYGGGGTYGYHYDRSRSQLTLREKARIQTFDDNFQFEGKGVRAQIGEAVPPLLGEIIGKAILGALSQLSI